MLNVSTNWLEISFLNNFNIFLTALLWPIVLLESREEMFCISDLSVGLSKRNFEFCFLGTQRNV